MDDEKEKKHKRTKLKMRIAGSVLLVAGLICAVIGFIDISGGFGDPDGMPMFWLIMIGFPLIAIGATFLLFSFQRDLQRFVKNEGVPVFNEMGKEITPGLSSMAKAVGLAQDKLVCPSCGTANDVNAKFCKNCGVALSRVCPQCGEKLDADSAFCDNCGRKLDDDPPRTD